MHFAGEGGCYGVLSDGKLRLFLLAEAPTFLSFFAFSGWGSFISPIKFRRPSQPNHLNPTNRGNLSVAPEC
jgi:hypothetical protein